MDEDDDAELRREVLRCMSPVVEELARGWMIASSS